MASKKTSFDTQGKQITNALYNLNLGSQTKDAISTKPNVSSINRSPGAITSMTRSSLGSPPNRSKVTAVDEPFRDAKNRSPITSNTRSPQEARAQKSPSGKGNNYEQPKRVVKPQSGNKSPKVNEKDNQHQSTSDSIYAKAAENTSPNEVISPGMTACKICGRSFLIDRIDAHEKACVKMHNKKRKTFVARKMVDGQQPVKNKFKSAPQPKSKSNWRKTHEEFVANIRAARQAQKILDAGGSLADLPPPPPSDTSHLTPCPHCGRKFSESAAARHIPLCKEKAIRAKLAAPKGTGRGSGSGVRGGGTRMPGGRGAR